MEMEYSLDALKILHIFNAYQIKWFNKCFGYLKKLVDSIKT